MDVECPKRMDYGPCGGVLPDGGCEMRPGRCAFSDVVPWTGVPAEPRPVNAPRVWPKNSLAIRLPESVPHDTTMNRFARRTEQS